MKTNYSEITPGQVFSFQGVLYLRCDDHILYYDNGETIVPAGTIGSVSLESGSLTVGFSGDIVVETFPSGRYECGDDDTAWLLITETNTRVSVDPLDLSGVEKYNALGRVGCWKYNRVKQEVYRNEGVDDDGGGKIRRLAHHILQVSEDHVISFVNGDKTDYRRRNLEIKGRHYRGVYTDPRNSQRPYRAQDSTTMFYLAAFARKEDAATMFDLYLVGADKDLDLLNFPERVASYRETWKMYRSGLNTPPTFSKGMAKIAELNNEQVVVVGARDDEPPVENDWEDGAEQEADDKDALALHMFGKEYDLLRTDQQGQVDDKYDTQSKGDTDAGRDTIGDAGVGTETS